MKNGIKESFRWLEPTFEIDDRNDKNTIWIKGIAMRAGGLSRNKRKYVDEELKRAARTWEGKPITINHDMNLNVGHVVRADYDDDDAAIEYIGKVHKQPYVRMLRDGSAKIHGVSIEATYIHMRCPECNERFYSPEDFHSHMASEHFIKTDPTKEVHGMRGTALSLVLSPEECGYEGTTIELMEKYFDPALQLLETVHKNPIFETKKEVKEYLRKTRSKAVIQPESRQVFDKQLKEQDGFKQGEEPATHKPEDGTADCGEGMHLDPETNMCVADTLPEVNITDPEPPATKSTTEAITISYICPEGFILDSSDPQNQTCILKPLPKSDPPTDAPKIVPEPTITIPKVDVTTPAPAGSATETVADTENPLVPDLAHGLEPTPHPAPDDKTKCLPGTHFDAEVNTCVPDEIAEAPATTASTDIIPKVTVESLPALLKLGEPFANYTDHADCVAKNPNKDDPDAYCADIKRKAEPASEIKESMNIYEIQKAILKKLVEVDRKAYINDVKLAESMNKINTAVAKTMVNNRNTQASIQKLNKAVLSESKLRHAYDRGTAKQILDQLGKMNAATATMLKAATNKASSINEATVKQLNKALETVQEHLGKLASSAIVNKTVAEYRKLMGNLATEIAKTNRLIIMQKRVVDKALLEVPKIAELAKTQKRDFEKILSVADKNILESNDKIKSLEDWKAAKEQETPEPCPEGQHRDADGKCVADEKTEETKKLEEMATRMENLESKLKGDFKGKTKALQETTNKTEYYKDPLKTKPKKRK